MQGSEIRDQGSASQGNPVEPWLRGTHGELDAVVRQVVHALELAGEDAARWCARLTDAEMGARPFGLAPVAFHLRHIARSLDRLLSYAEGTQLEETQRLALAAELEAGATTVEVMAEFWAGLTMAERRVLAFTPEQYNAARGVGGAKLPSTVGGLLVHCAEHTQRHIGQAVTTAKVVVATGEADPIRLKGPVAPRRGSLSSNTARR